MENPGRIKTIILGDIHGQFNELNKFIERHQPDILIQAGDNAYYWDDEATGAIKALNTKVYLVPGNHENWDMIEERIGRHGIIPVEVDDNIFYCPIGSSIEIEGNTVLFVGGADSVDKEYRIPGRTWWSQELLTEADVEYVLKNVKKVDIVVSHTCPSYFMFSNIGYDLESKLKDPTRRNMNALLDYYNIKHWYFGHWHQSMRGQFRETMWRCLNMLNFSNDHCLLGE